MDNIPVMCLVLWTQIVSVSEEEAATYAKYWITFFVFSVLPAPDSPLKTKLRKPFNIRGNCGSALNSNFLH